MKKIGILTYFLDDNPGTFMQSHSTVQALRRRFPSSEIEIINYAYTTRRFRVRRSTIASLPGSLFRDYRRYHIYKSIKAELLPLGKDKLRTKDSRRATEFMKKQNYDLIVVGSDLILQWFPFHFKNNMVPPSWLSPEIKCRKVLAAASAAQLEISQLTEDQKEYIRKVVSEFELLGVRDKPTYRLIQNLGVTDERLQIVPDPTFSYSIDYAYADQLIKRKGIDLAKPIIFLHLTHRNTYASGLAKEFRRKGYQILSLNEAKYADTCITDISPMEWAAILKKATLVVTGRFHDSIFCLKNCVPIYLVPSAEWLFDKEGDSKFYSLMKAFDLSETNFTPTSELKSVDDFYKRSLLAVESFNKQKVQNTLNILKRQYENYISKIKK